MHLLNDWFGYPDGSVLTNLVASVIAFIVGYFAAVRRHVKSLHSKIDRLHDHLGVPPEQS